MINVKKTILISGSAVITKNQLRYYSGLKDRKNREECGLFIAEGLKTVTEGVISGIDCEAIIVSDKSSAKEAIINDRLFKNCKLLPLDHEDFKKISDTENSQGVIGIFKRAPLMTNDITSNKLIVLNQIADPRNMGTIIRTADWFGYNELLISEDSVDIFNTKVVRSTMGSIFHIKFFVTKEIVPHLKLLQQNGYKVLTADMNGKDYRKIGQVNNRAIIFSNESRGPAQDILNLTDDLITIPGDGKAESLSVAIAASIIMAEYASK